MLTTLDTAKTGLLQSERRATELAKEILLSGSKVTSFSLEEEKTSTTQHPSDAATRPEDGINTGPSTTVSTHHSYSDIIQNLADLKAETHAFKANALLFERADQMLGTLLDDEG